jgi:hypothetical protein
MADEKDLSWKKPDWATKSNLKSTSKSAAIKSGGNLAAPITNLPHQKKDGDLAFEKPEWTDEAAAKEGHRVEGDLAKPITGLPQAVSGNANLAFEKPDWTKKKTLKQSEKGAALAEGKAMERAIGGIKAIDDDE